MDWLKNKCPDCKQAKTLVESRYTISYTISGVRFMVEVQSVLCESCGSRLYGDEALEKAELAVAIELGARGVRTGEAFKFIRKAIGMRATDLAELLDVTAETISRWEREAVEIDHAAFAVLGALASERREAKTEMLDRLKAARDPKLPKKPIKLVAA